MSPPFVDIDGGHRLFVRDWGAGRPALKLASWGMDSRLWSSTMLALNDGGVRTIAYDRREHGESTDPGVVNYDLLADDLNEVVEGFRKSDRSAAYAEPGEITTCWRSKGLQASRRCPAAATASGPVWPPRCCRPSPFNPSG